MWRRRRGRCRTWSPRTRCRWPPTVAAELRCNTSADELHLCTPGQRHHVLMQLLQLQRHPGALNCTEQPHSVHGDHSNLRISVPPFAFPSASRHLVCTRIAVLHTAY